MKFLQKKTILSLVLINYFFVMFLGFAHLDEMALMNTPMENCPFAFLEHTVCQMSIVDHLKSWQYFLNFLAVYKTFSFAILGLFVIYILFNSRTIIRYLLYARRRRKDFSFYEHLFSQGILNPKLF